MIWENLMLEDSPSPEQVDRLRDFLSEIRLISGRYHMSIDTESDYGPVIVDTDSGTVVGIGLVPQLKSETDPRIDAFDCESSILDGAWLAD